MKFKIIFAGFILLFFHLAGAETDLTANQIMQKADATTRAPFEVLKMKMVLTDKDKPVAERSFVWYLQNDHGNEISLLKFLSPANVQNTGILVKEAENNENLIWEYLPATRDVRRIPGTHKQNRFMGTEMVFEDFEGFKLNHSNFKLLGKISCAEAGKQCYQIESTPATNIDQEQSSYAKKIYLIESQNFYLVKASLYDKNQIHAKTYDLQGYQYIGGFWRPKNYTMSNLLTHCKTEMIVLDRQMNQPFSTYYVSQRYLRSE